MPRRRSKVDGAVGRDGQALFRWVTRMQGGERARPVHGAEGRHRMRAHSDAAEAPARTARPGVRLHLAHGAAA
jgi:hypothetical protein